ncbi:MAG: TonB family protein [Rhodocyclaceae bacterium]|nr:TonB family protein [Rhodocyclaceae bacterium]MBK9310717.1 TonB family protein [Rhodocyclaceae bacterium]
MHLPMFTTSGDASFGIARAVAVSVLVHALLLWPGTRAWQPSIVAPPLTALLRPGAMPGPAAPTAATGISSPATVEQQTKPALPPTRPRLKEVANTPPPANLATDSSTGTAAPRSEAAGADAPMASSLAPSDGLDADGVRAYRLALAREARRYKRYPREAIEAGWQGTVEVLVAVAAGGVAEAPQLVRSSGQAALDDAALDMLRHALPATPLPPTLRGRPFAVNLPVVFELPD